MSRFDLNRTLIQPSAEVLRSINEYNPLFIHKKGTRTKAIFALSTVCFLWGTTWIVSKEGVKYMPGLQLAGIRQLIAGLLYVIYFMIRGTKFPRKKEWITILVLSCLNFVFSNGLSTWGVKFIPAGLASIMAAIFPLWLVLISLFTASSKVPVKAIIGFLLGFTGICIIFYEHLDSFFNADFRFGILLTLVSTWTWTFAMLYTKKHAASFNPYFSLGLQMVIAGTALIGITAASGTAISIFHIPWQSWASISYLVIFGSIIAFIAYLYALQNLPTEQTALYAYVNPIVAVMLGTWLLGEHLTIFITLGGAVALLGVYMINKAYRVILK